MIDTGGGDPVLHPHWVEWVAENLARGASPNAVTAALVEEGLDDTAARAHVDEVLRSPIFSAARTMANRARALEIMVRLRAEHRAGLSPGIDRIPLPAVETFLARHWMPGIPVVLTDLVTRWPAFQRWSPAYFSERFGTVSQQVCANRASEELPDADWDRTTEDISVAELMRRIQGSGPSNDLYVIAKNGAWQNPGLRGLLEDLDLPPEYFGEYPVVERMGLWIGPAGTHTPLHHDGDDAFFCQVVGRKRFRLAPPESMALLERSRGVYCQWDPEELAPDDPERLVELVLEAGDTLFIPAGWWHQVDALDTSFSVSILELAWPNNHDWYKPGTALRGRPV